MLTLLKIFSEMNMRWNRRFWGRKPLPNEHRHTWLALGWVAFVLLFFTQNTAVTGDSSSFQSHTQKGLG